MHFNRRQPWENAWFKREQKKKSLSAVNVKSYKSLNNVGLQSIYKNVFYSISINGPSRHLCSNIIIWSCCPAPKKGVRQKSVLVAPLLPVQNSSRSLELLSQSWSFGENKSLLGSEKSVNLATVIWKPWAADLFVGNLQFDWLVAPRGALCRLKVEMEQKSVYSSMLPNEGSWKQTLLFVFKRLHSPTRQTRRRGREK